MACAIEHAQFKLIAVTCACAIVRDSEGLPADATPIAVGAAAACLPSLPDVLEPALHPNHRKFFHSVAVFACLGYGLHRLYKWEAEDDWQRLLRVAGLVAGAAYLAHLTRDAFTAKSLPLI
jgi:inner membrane protein